MRNRVNRRNRKHRIASRNVVAALSMLFPPLGIFLVWRTDWSDTVKYCLTGAAVLVLAIGVALMPSPSNRTNGGIELIGREQAVEVYGPALPTAMVTGYTVQSTSSLFAEDTEDEIEYVYAMKEGQCYHTYKCKYAYASSQKLTVYEAYHLGYKACGLCNPPVYSPAQ